MDGSNGKQEASEEQKIGFMEMIKLGYGELVNAIIRPPRAEYSIQNLGPTLFSVGNIKVKRNDFTLKNPRSLDIHCSHWEPITASSAAPSPCVIYLHGNCGCRVEVVEYLPALLQSGITVLSYDASGCGMSEGEFISLGWYERDDIDTIVKYLRSTSAVSTIGLWGRSMGAVTALLHGDRDPSIAALVLDSPFASLRQLANELVENQPQLKIKVPGFAISGALRMVRSTIKKKAKFDIYDLSPIDHADKCFIPALFCCANGDEFIRPHHAQQIHDA